MQSDSVPHCRVTDLVLSQQRPLDMLWQPIPCLLLLTCLHTQEWRIKRSAFWLLLKGGPICQRQVACLIMKITLMWKAVECQGICYLHLKEHKIQCHITLFASNRTFFCIEFHTINHSTALRRKKNHDLWP